MAGNWGQAGGSTRVDPAGRWIASLPREEIELYPEYLDELSLHKDKPYKDRRQELVIITIADNQSEIEDLLDSALLTDEEMTEGPEAWKDYTDNFPHWN
jgi:hypothetical protein